MQNEGIEDKGELGVSLDNLSAAMADVGSNWERVPLRHSEGREGWEDAMLGCLKDVRFIFHSQMIALNEKKFSYAACLSFKFSSSSRNSDPVIIFP